MTFLIKKPGRPGDIITFKLETSEEVIAKLVEETDTIFKLERPMTLSYSAQGVGLTPWIITSDYGAVIEVEKRRVLAQTPTMKTAAEQYIQNATPILK
jgi:hypothetical protein